MTRPRTVTHTYTLQSGWQKSSEGPLTAELAEALRSRGVSMVRARRGLFDVREVSLLNDTPVR
ncbi:alternative tryptophan synthase beta-subunit [Microbacterium sp. VKM Ac-2923]|uniref:alternative tryptophan synthase beta-subunit n=1 Tax=Microbacterium sp. VKM Ac-2923 TaxID=2929476 RepID=UPI001FB48671|nr:alternative tryptophan synthase beta-subunit [Microbacterium sp. VKM Ac-2923]MCJ1708037.1 alternative tryptophan synthase beta-subunit [Microbacterium sp. VKM Ac-2923]